MNYKEIAEKRRIAVALQEAALDGDTDAIKALGRMVDNLLNEIKLEVNP